MASPAPASASQQQVFDRDLDRMNRQLRDLGAVVTTADGFAYIDQGKAPADLVDAYRGLARYGYANGLL